MGCKEKRVPGAGREGTLGALGWSAPPFLNTAYGGVWGVGQ